jgi:hypothetical protein
MKALRVPGKKKKVKSEKKNSNIQDMSKKTATTQTMILLMSTQNLQLRSQQRIPQSLVHSFKVFRKVSVEQNSWTASVHSSSFIEEEQEASYNMGKST